jgi:RNA polymerase sigma-70 factor, ECF subfamily
MDELTRLALAARHGRPRALDRFIEAGYPDVWRLCASLLDSQSAEDLAQETFLRATQALPRFRGESSARTWLLAIAHRVCVDELRARGRRRKRDERIEQLGQEQAIDPDLAGEIGVRQLLAVLDPDRRAAFVLTQIFRLSYEQAAGVCGCPPGTIRSRVARARDDLIVALGEAGRRTESRSEAEVRRIDGGTSLQ